MAQFDLWLLDHCLTSNHVHLMACAEEPEQISRFMQKVAGEWAQSYNRRKRRSGACWEDRFHSTMIEPGGHLERCMVHIALNLGSETFVRQVAEETRGRHQLKIEGVGETWSLKEPTVPYSVLSSAKTKCKKLRDR